MAREDRIIMSIKELRRGHIIHRILERSMTQAHAAEVMGLSDRQVRRLIKRVREEGDRGVVHRSRGRPSNRAIEEKTKGRVLALYRTKYGDFGPTLATEKLAERDGLTLSEATLRRWLLAEGIDHFTRRKRPHRQWRERKRHCGEMLQLDGSHHDWLEGRGPPCVLMAYIDDATSRVWARFYAYEGTIPAMDSFGRYVRRYGIPLAIYADRHTTYQSPAGPTIEEQLAGQGPMSQFKRALTELGVELIPAHSPRPRAGSSGCSAPSRIGSSRRCAWRGSRPSRRPTGSSRAICPSTIGASRSSRPRPPISTGRSPQGVPSRGSSASRPGGP